MNLELKALVKAGARLIQIDEPYYSGFPEDLVWGVKVLNTLVEGVDAKIAVHICYGNRYGKPSWEGSYRYLFPAILDAKVQQLTLEFARRGGEDLDLFKEFAPPFELGLGGSAHPQSFGSAACGEDFHSSRLRLLPSAARRCVRQNASHGGRDPDRAKGIKELVQDGVSKSNSRSVGQRSFLLHGGAGSQRRVARGKIA
jgi:hypothetical protein